jgi:ABC-type Mn2+/Zn2+ transport system ATPase subunit
LFSDSKERISLIYGKNGTGKSTISKAVLKVSGKELIDYNGKWY